MDFITGFLRFVGKEKAAIDVENYVENIKGI
jgi:hypothetical protein